MVAFLVSEEAQWVNGQIIGVNGVSGQLVVLRMLPSALPRHLSYETDICACMIYKRFGSLNAAHFLSLLLIDASLYAIMRYLLCCNSPSKHATLALYDRGRVVIYASRPSSPPCHAPRLPLLRRCRMRIHPHIIRIHPAIYIKQASIASTLANITNKCK